MAILKPYRCEIDGDKVHIDFPEGFVSWQSALKLAQMLKEQAKKAEANAERERIIDDTATSMRAGLGIDLTNGDPKMLEEAKKRAQWDRAQRTRIPSVMGNPQVFAPRVRVNGS